MLTLRGRLLRLLASPRAPSPLPQKVLEAANGTVLGPATRFFSFLVLMPGSMVVLEFMSHRRPTAYPEAVRFRSRCC